MNRLLIGLLTVFLSLTSIAQNPVERLGVKENLEFDNTTYKLAWSAKPRNNYLIQEYLPEGETTAYFKQMLTIHLFLTDIKTKDAVKLKVNELIAIKKTDPVCNYQVTASPDKKEFLVDFVLGESKNNEMTLVEFNVYRYKQIQISKNQKAILVYAFSKRSYGEDITEFFKTLGEDRLKYLNEMISTKLPDIKIENN